MSVLANSAVIGDGAVNTGDIRHSLRFRSAASAYLSRTFGTPTDAKTYTVSFWCKRGKLGVAQAILDGYPNGYTYMTFAADDTVYFAFNNITPFISTAKFRDPTAAIHFVLVVDTTQATADDRFKLYANGVLLTGARTAVTQNTADAYWNAAGIDHKLGMYYTGNYLDGYLSRIAFVDGQALTPSSFGYLNTEINEWVSKSQSQVKAVVDAGGTNSFMLDFDDATSLTTLGYDLSTHGNDWTLNNFSLTAGTTYDHMLDVPGNSYATLNPLDVRASGVTFSAGNLQMLYSTAAWRTACSSIAVSAGKWYSEADVTQAGSGTALVFGASTLSGLTNGTNLGDWVGSIGIGKGTAGALFAVQGTYPSAPHTIAANDRNLIAIDCDAGKAWLGYYDASVPSTTWFSSAGAATGDPVAGTNPTMTFTAGTPMVVAQGIYATSTAYAAYFGASGFTATQPTGFLALCQANLPAPAILNPELHFDVVLATGANIKTTSEAVFPSNFFEWIKDRANSNNHQLLDTVRGNTAVLQSNTTAAETTYSAPSGSSVGWVWKAGGASVSNTSGSITSQVSANVDAGFSIVTYTGTGANATVGHGLGKAPGLVIVKRRDGAIEWIVGHKYLTSAAYYLNLNTTNAQVSNATVFNSAAPTSTVFSVGTNVTTNGNGNTCVAYCFADIEGYSKAFSYTGNGSADGPFVHLGFKPKWILVKCSSNAGLDWFIWDTVRDTYNQVARDIYPNVTNAEELNNRGPDVTSSGFKIRNAATYFNGSGYNYIGTAFADVPGKYSLAR